jgi:hypothetical protein
VNNQQGFGISLRLSDDIGHHVAKCLTIEHPFLSNFAGGMGVVGKHIAVGGLEAPVAFCSYFVLVNLIP